MRGSNSELPRKISATTPNASGLWLIIFVRSNVCLICKPIFLKCKTNDMIVLTGKRLIINNRQVHVTKQHFPCVFRLQH